MTRNDRSDISRKVVVVLASAYFGNVCGSIIFSWPNIGVGSLLSPLCDVLYIWIPYVNILLAANMIFAILFVAMKWPYYLAGFIAIGFGFLGYWSVAAWRVH